MSGRGQNVVRLPAGRNGQSPRPNGGRGTGGFDTVLPDLNKLTRGLGLDGQKGKPLDPKHKEAIVKFEKQFEELRKQVGYESTDFRSDVTKRALYRSMLTMLLEMVPLAQQKYYEQRTEGAMYTLLALANKIQDLQTAITMSESLEEQAEHISANIFVPLMTQAVNSLCGSLLTTKGKFDNYNLGPRVTTEIKSHVDNLVRDHGLFLRDLNEAFAARVRDYLLGNVAAPSRTGPGQQRRKPTKR